MKKKTFVIATVISIFVIVAFLVVNTSLAEKSMDERRANFVDEKESMQHDMRMDGKYKCCLEKPCTYCIEKTPGHGEGAACLCIEDLMNGVHPCGECIGEIMEGHGNPFLSEYFARAIAEKVGERHHEPLKEMMSDMYDISVEEQV